MVYFFRIGQLVTITVIFTFQPYSRKPLNQTSATWVVLDIFRNDPVNINDGEYRRGNKKWTLQRKKQQNI